MAFSRVTNGKRFTALSQDGHFCFLKATLFVFVLGHTFPAVEK